MKSVSTIHLICNAHIDPVWQWEWQEGAAEAVSTFRVAADFCEKFNGFIFCHNEAILYEWIEEYEPALFGRIQKLVKSGKWHIMGGWYLQPDCNMPCGESFVRQILLGREYFGEKFGKYPTTAINFDPFGHSRGLVQIMAKSGFDSYLFCRPHEKKDCPLPSELFQWEGFDGSRITALRCWGHYSSERGQAAQKIRDFISSHNLASHNLVLWGIGNHGGGPSLVDLKDIAKLAVEQKDLSIIHSTPENFFHKIPDKTGLPVFSKSLNAWGVGCYTSQILIKQLNRQIENELFSTEKMLISAWKQGLIASYPQSELKQAMKLLALVQFHDILPGTSVEDVEKSSIQTAHHGLDILSSLKAKAFFALTAGQKRGTADNIPILVYNPHPFPVRMAIECEYQLQDMQRIENGFHIGTVYQNGKAIPSQMEKEASTIRFDWRKRVVFEATLAPSQMNRFDCRIKKLSARPKPALNPKNGKYLFKGERVEAVINSRTGLLDKYMVDGRNILKKSAFRPIVLHDKEEPWGMLNNNRFDKTMAKFTLLTPEKSAEFSGLANLNKLAPIRVIEDGDVRTIIEAVFGYNDSFICQRYILPKHVTQMEVSCTVIWNEKDRMLKLDIPVAMQAKSFYGQVAYGVEELEMNGRESVAQKWVAVTDNDTALTLINDGTYGCDLRKGSLRPTLLRSPAYCAHPVHELLPIILPQDRFLPRIDTGPRTFRFQLNAGNAKERFSHIDREATIMSEKPMVLSFFPSGDGRKPETFIKLSGSSIQLAAMKKAMYNDDIIIRLFNPTGYNQNAVLTITTLNIKEPLSFMPFELLSLRVQPSQKRCVRISIDEKPRA